MSPAPGLNPRDVRSITEVVAVRRFGQPLRLAGGLAGSAAGRGGAEALSPDVARIRTKQCSITLTLTTTSTRHDPTPAAAQPSIEGTTKTAQTSHPREGEEDEENGEERYIYLVKGRRRRKARAGTFRRPKTGPFQKIGSTCSRLQTGAPLKVGEIMGCCCFYIIPAPGPMKRLNSESKTCTSLMSRSVIIPLSNCRAKGISNVSVRCGRIP